jgi:hypothetical protein
MPIVSFRSGLDESSCGWRRGELQHLLSECSASVSNGAASGWAFGETERGDPQLYLLGPEPECDCILCVSRLDDLYILEDGKGQLIAEFANLVLLCEQVALLRAAWAKPPHPCERS